MRARTLAGAVALDPAVAIGQGGDRSGATGHWTTGHWTTGHWTTVAVSMIDTRLNPDMADVAVGNTLMITLSNDDMLHDLVLANGVQSGPVEPGAGTSVAVGVNDGTEDAGCSLGGHHLLGMVLTVNAVGAADDSGSDKPRSDGTIMHAIDFQAKVLAPGKAMGSIAP
ncbi:MAG: hypothetical protein LH475_01435 [Cryobacterium sp.]|uniref:hypothetical protein n=1 Tax=unclassified Cryobacterium TaxID=2649013 RepID=UPI0018C9648F|nr:MULTISPECIES: hypothetical protein [unclassified Cryobacterium]MCY7403291.1 hypothetical protein [Cryobacterium sp.]MEC5155510.1 hypothetical protein [Cryobacterium sp. CAN_C3]